MVKALKTLDAIVVTVGKLIPLIILFPDVAVPVKATSIPLAVIDPDAALLVRLTVTPLSLLLLVEYVSVVLPDDRTKFP